MKREGKSMRQIGYGLVLAALLAGTARAENPKVSPAAGEVVVLPPLLVEWKNAPLHWRYLELPGLELLTVCSDNTTVEFARRNLRLEEMLRVLVPERFLFKSSVPESHILFNEETGRARSPEVIKEMLRGQGARVGSDGTVRLPVGIDPPALTLPFGRNVMARFPERRIYFLPNLRLGDRDSQAIFSILAENNSFPTFVFSEDRVQFLLERRTPALPDWYVEGMLGLYRQAGLDEGAITLRPAVWLSAEESRALAGNAERSRVLLPMRELLTRRRPAGLEAAGETDRIWQAQCALFVRWAVAGENGRHRDGLGKFVDRLEKEPLSEALFRECLGVGFADMRDRLSDTLPEAVGQSRRLEAPKAEPLPRLRPRPATALEVARIRGEWERREIGYVRSRYPELTDKYLEQARTTLYRAHEAGERDPRLLAVLGLTELEAGDKGAARRFLEEAVRGGVGRPQACLELARLRYDDLPADETKLTAGQVGGVLAPLHQALEHAPPLIEAYALMAVIWSRSLAAPDGAEIALLNEGARLFPQVSAYLLRVIYLNVANGQVAPARALAEAGLQHARAPDMQERFRRVLAELAVMGR